MSGAKRVAESSDYCPICDGDGQYFDELNCRDVTCWKCGGTGFSPDGAGDVGETGMQQLEREGGLVGVWE